MNKLGFFGGKHMGFHCLQFLIQSKIKPEFVVVNSDDNCNPGPFYDSTKKLAIENDLLVLENIDDVLLHDVDLILSIGFTKIIKNKLLKHPKIGIINAHPAPLPKYRGRFSTMHAILNGEKTHGITFHFMDEQIDGGDVILKKEFPIDKKETGKSLYLKSSNMIIDEFKKLLKLLYENNIPKRIPQNDVESTYFKKEIPNNGIIDPSWDSEKIDRFVRALYFPSFEPAKMKVGKTFKEILPENI